MTEREAQLIRDVEDLKLRVEKLEQQIKELAAKAGGDTIDRTMQTRRCPGRATGQH